VNCENIPEGKNNFAFKNTLLFINNGWTIVLDEAL